MPPDFVNSLAGIQPCVLLDVLFLAVFTVQEAEWVAVTDPLTHGAKIIGFLALHRSLPTPPHRATGFFVFGFLPVFIHVL